MAMDSTIRVSRKRRLALYEGAKMGWGREGLSCAGGILICQQNGGIQGATIRTSDGSMGGDSEWRQLR